MLLSIGVGAVQWFDVRNKTLRMTQPTYKQKSPSWRVNAKAHALDYLQRFAFNKGVEMIVDQYDTHFRHIKRFDERIDYLKGLAAQHWDYRKGRERYEITETYEIDEPDSELGKIVFEGAAIADMGTSSRATLKHYSMLVILGGANRSPYLRLRFGLEQNVTYDTLVYLGSERKVLPPEYEKVKDYAPGAQTEFDLGIGAINTLMAKQLDESGRGSYDVCTSEWHIARMQTKKGNPIFSLSSPPYLGGGRANTADTYDFLRRLEQEALEPATNLLFATNSTYRYAQYFDAMREICLRTGADIETIGFDPAYAGLQFKPTQFLQELKAAADAAVRLRDAVGGREDRNAWREQYYSRFSRIESDRPL